VEGVALLSAIIAIVLAHFRYTVFERTVYIVIFFSFGKYTIVRIILQLYIVMENEGPVENVDVPREIIRIGCFTGTMFLILAVTFLIYRKYERAILVFALYITTCVHWNEIKYGSWIHIIDMCVAAAAISVSMYMARNYPPLFWRLFGTALAIGIVCFIADKFVSANYTDSIGEIYIKCMLHFSWMHLIAPAIYLWGFLRYEV
jgi:hypothetical protein